MHLWNGKWTGFYSSWALKTRFTGHVTQNFLAQVPYLTCACILDKVVSGSISCFKTLQHVCWKSRGSNYWLLISRWPALSLKPPAVCCKEVGLFLEYNETLLCLKDKKYHPKKRVLPDALARLVAVTTAAVVCLPFWVMGRTGSWCKPGVRLRASPACTALSTVWITRSLVSWASEDKAYDSNVGTRQQSSQILQ